MPPLLMALFSGMASGAGYLLAQAGGKLISYIPTQAQSDRDKIYAKTHDMVSTAVAAKFDPDKYVQLANGLHDTIRQAANRAG